jgi:hypothetical protein
MRFKMLDYSDECFNDMENLFSSTDMTNYCKINAYKYALLDRKYNKEEYIRTALWYLNKAELILDVRKANNGSITILVEYAKKRLEEYKHGKVKR